MKIKEGYEWLLLEPGPKMILEFLKLYGIKETIGPADNPVIMSWAQELGLNDYIHDSIAWCGLEMAIVAKRAEKEVVDHPLWAANWLKFGVPVANPMLGDVCVFKRPGGNHVGLYLAEDNDYYHIGGGNQSDMVGITRINKQRLIGARRPKYKIATPANVRRIFVAATGEVSHDEK